MIKIGKDCNLDLKKLIATRLLINSNSGGGKSWAIRRILEQSHGKVQQIIIDLEGEFSTLREEFDYLLVGKDGEIQANIKTAELLAKKLLELNVSTIIDLSELKHPERITFVKRFLDSLINSPKELWHPALIVIDESHIFCPEGAKSESASAVIDLATRGRKRGFSCLLATQRISKLSKDAIAELNNYMTGRTGLDIDQKRASEILGFTNKEDMRSLRDLKAGEFYVFGSAFEHNGVQKIMVGEIKTTHQDRTKGVNIIKPIKTPENIKKLMKDIVDLPKEAEEELRNTEDMKKKIRELKYQLTLAEKSKSVKIDEKAIERAKEQAVRETENHYEKELKKLNLEHNQYVKKIEQSILPILKRFSDILSHLNSLNLIKRVGTNIKVDKLVSSIAQEFNFSKEEIISKLGKCEKEIYNFLLNNPTEEFSKEALGEATNYSSNSGGFNNSISRLNTLGLIIRNGGLIQLNPELLEL